MRDDSTVLALNDLLAAGIVTPETTGSSAHDLIHDALLTTLGPTLKNYENEWGDMISMFRDEAWSVSIFDRAIDMCTDLSEIIELFDRIAGDAKAAHEEECREFALRSEMDPLQASSLHGWLGWLCTSHYGISSPSAWLDFVGYLGDPGEDEEGNETPATDERDIEVMRAELRMKYPYLIEPPTEPPISHTLMRETLEPYAPKLAAILYDLAMNLRRPDDVFGNEHYTVVIPSFQSPVHHGLERLHEQIMNGYFDASNNLLIEFSAINTTQMRERFASIETWLAPIHKLCTWSFRHEPTSPSAEPS